MAIFVVQSIADRVRSFDWLAIESSLDAQGFARIPSLLSPRECADLTALYDDEARFRSRIEMERFRFGVGEYKYFAHPLPAQVQQLRDAFYARLAPVANRWMALLQPATDRRKPDTKYPALLRDFLARCHAAGQRRPTPLLLSYTAGGYNCLHQDIYGDIAFPMQVVFVLSRTGTDFTGGELLLVEQRPRAQSRGHTLAVEQGAGVVFPTRERPVQGARGVYRVVMRHGVSTILSGSRMSLGVIFHDAK